MEKVGIFIIVASIFLIVYACINRKLITGIVGICLLSIGFDTIDEYVVKPKSELIKKK